MAGAKERLEVAAFSWNLVGNLVVVYWLYEGIVKPVTMWFEMSCDDGEVHAEDYRRGATGYRVPIRRDSRDVASCCITKPNAPGRRTKEAGVKMRCEDAFILKQFCSPPNKAILILFEQIRVPQCGSKRWILFTVCSRSSVQAPTVQEQAVWKGTQPIFVGLKSATNECRPMM